MDGIDKATLAEIRGRLAPRIEQAARWLTARGDPITWAELRAKLTLTTVPIPQANVGRVIIIGLVVGLLLWLFIWYVSGQIDDKGAVTYPHTSLINPILGGLGALLLIYAAIRQARTASEQAETARRQAQIAADRHAAQTTADLQRRITETFSKAVEQLGSEKIEVRVGGIYKLERLAGEALASPAEEGGPDLYWTVMETLTAFVRERSRWHARGAAAARMEDKADYPGPKEPEESQPPEPATDIAAVLAVIRRRPEAGRGREAQREWRFDLRGAELRGANLNNAHLDGAILNGVHLEGADIVEAHLAGADLGEAHLDDADLERANLEGANLSGAYLEGAHVGGAHLNGANLMAAYLKNASFRDAHLKCANFSGVNLEGSYVGGARLEGADLFAVAHLEDADLDKAHGDARTRLPKEVVRPAHWPAYDRAAPDLP